MKAQPRAEANRIAEVYRGYAVDRAKRRAWSLDNAGNRAILDERERQIRALLGEHGILPFEDLPILDVGCGVGQQLTMLRGWEARPECLHGIDLIEPRVQTARRAHPGLDIRLGSAHQLRDDDAAFGLVLLFTVMSSILDDAIQRNVARELDRVLRPGGSVLWYDFRRNNPANSNVRRVTGVRIAELFTNYVLDLRSITLLPPLARRLGPLTGPLYPQLARLRALRTHTLGVLTKPA